MKLKKIIASGFKSFADKIEIDVNPGITGIVGPNGSGKSNVVDAVKWVLGEQSIKSLRGNKDMTDVIFSGSKSRESLSRCFVSLIFDNSDHYLNSEFEELEIKRVLYKTGENDYYINNTKVRLKDIINLFLDSGASKESFNIISQGNVKDVVNSKPEDRRVIFESAAGVLKYKKRKEESKRKLEKTKDNIDVVTLLINELELQLNPLKEQSEKAIKYNEIYNDLKNKEIALLANDINTLNDECNKNNISINEINEKILNIDNLNISDTTLIEKLKLESIKIDEELNQVQKNYNQTIDELNELKSQKQINLERQKYVVDDLKVQNNIVELKEHELKLKNDIAKILVEKDNIKEEINNYNNKLNTLANDYKINTSSLDVANNDIISNDKTMNYTQNKLEILENNIENNSKLPASVKTVLNTASLTGIHDIIGNIIKIPDKYIEAINISLSYNSNFIIVDDESVAKNAIEFLNRNKLGRATFFPLNVIKPKYIDETILNNLKSTYGFIGIASDLVSYDKIYDNIIKNQLGNVIVCDNIDNANIISKIVKRLFRIVTLNGEIIHSGGSITGGSSKLNTILSDKQEIMGLKAHLNSLKRDKDILITKVSSLNEEKSIIENNVYQTRNKLVELNELFNIKENTEKNYNEELTNILNEINGSSNLINNSLDDAINNIMIQYYQKEQLKNEIEINLNKLKNNKSELTLQIEEKTNIFRKSNSEYNNLVNNLKNLEITVARDEVKLDNALKILSEDYNLTYERAYNDYKLTADVEEIRLIVNSKRKELKQLGDVNLASIEEYNRVKERYDFLDNQRNDLLSSLNNLNGIIEEMDLIMIDKFSKTFDKIKKEFQVTFNQMFKGGNGILKLTNPDDILNTGIDIIAEPPGKKINSIALLSGGEKTLTAIALLFAIINVKTVPFCILDEVEESLDEANVDVFGHYLQQKKSQSQFIIITHKKRSMEYADVLFGITMQESGVSKLVSVKLDNI